MNKTLSLICATLLGVQAGTVLAADTDAVIGGAVGGAVGAAVGSELGGRNGAIAGSAAGAAIGTAVATDGQGHSSHGVRIENDHHGRGGPPGHAYRVPPGHAKHSKHKH